jgi:hypothetical protein
LVEGSGLLVAGYPAEKQGPWVVADVRVVTPSISFRKLIDCAVQPFRIGDASELIDKVRATLAMVHPKAAAIDVGATMHMSAVNPDRTAEAVRIFGTFTTDLHRLVDWFAGCGGRL